MHTGLVTIMLLNFSSLAYLIDELLPTMLFALDCDDAAMELAQAWRGPRAHSELPSALQEAADVSLECSARLGPELATRAEQVSLLALHLLRCVELGDCPAARSHYLRAYELGMRLGLPVGELAS